MNENGQVNNKRFSFSHKNNVGTVGHKSLKNYQDAPTTTSKIISTPPYVKLSAKSTLTSPLTKNNPGIETSKNSNNPTSAKYSPSHKANTKPKSI